MRKLRLDIGMHASISVRADRPGSAGSPLFGRDGAIVSRVFDSRTLPEGTRVEGRPWARGKTVIGRYTALELPNGRRYPVCLVLCDYDGCTRRSESTPDAPAVAHIEFFTVVDFFP
jgi:hypothetical protein